MEYQLFIQYTDEQIEKIGNEKFNLLVQKEAKRDIGFVHVGSIYDSEQAPYEAKLFRWEPETPEQIHCEQCKEPICLKCFEWRRYEPGQRHFGYTWWGTCKFFSQSCDCEHHKHEVWIA